MPTHNGPDPATLLDIYRRATLIKQNDERSRTTIRTARITMAYYSPRGQEIIPSAVSVSLTNDDYICTIYRGIHDMLAKGLPLKTLWAEQAGRTTGACKGKGGPMHITHPKSGIMVTTGIVGGSMPIAVGLAWSAQLKGEKNVTIAYFGDGASNIGAFHEAMNLAALWKLPVVFVCQNNRFGEHTRYENGTAGAQIATRAAGYGMPGVNVDGNDPDAMYLAAREAIERARSGGGPTLIEAMTFRFFGHVFGDDDSYMAPGEKDAAMKKDPVVILRARLIAEGISTEAELAAIEAQIETDLDEAIDEALAAPIPDNSELTTDVYGLELAQ
jgi:TPP-dependent pyruvate/acetoin dehydrogenase alpha subunit